MIPVVILLLVISLGLHQIFVSIQWQQALVIAHADALAERLRQIERSCQHDFIALERTGWAR